MAGPKRLSMGTEAPAPSAQELEQRLATLRATIEKYLPDFGRAVDESARIASGADAPPIVLHQDAFAAELDDDEYVLLGMAIKYAGTHGVVLHVIGTHRETLKPKAS